VVYVPGNHDEFARDYVGLVFGGVEVVESAVHETADGKKMLIIHGDQFDIVVRNARWLAFLGDWAYDWALWINTQFNRLRRVFGFGYWSFSAWAKLKVKDAVNFIGDFEQTLAAEAAKRGVDGVICAISTTRRSRPSTARSMSTSAISSKAARRSPNTRTEDLKSCIGGARPKSARPRRPSRRD